MEGKLGRIFGKFKLPNLGSQVLEAQIRLGETERTLRFNADRYNSAIERLSQMGLSEETAETISSVVKSGMAVQRVVDEIYWRNALIEAGLSLGKINEISNHRDATELNIEIEAPRFSTDASDNGPRDII